MLAPWDPIAEMASMRGEMDRMFRRWRGASAARVKERA
jgi:hypothetical protein